jgi:hypothetical protein
VRANCRFIQASSDDGVGRSKSRLKSSGIVVEDKDDDDANAEGADEVEDVEKGEVPQDIVLLEETVAVDVDISADPKTELENEFPFEFPLAIEEFVVFGLFAGLVTNEKPPLLSLGVGVVATTAASAATASRNDDNAAVLFGIATAGIVIPFNPPNDVDVV